MHNNEVPFPLLDILAGDKALFTHNRRSYNAAQGGMDVVPSSPKACDVLLGTPGASLDLFLQDNGKESPNSIISKSFWATTTSLVSRKCMERSSFFKLSRCWLRDFDYLVLFFLTMKMREDRLSAIIKIFYLKGLCDTFDCLSRP